MKTFIKILGLLVLSLVLAIVLFFGLRTYQGHKNLELVDKYLTQHHLKDKVTSEKTLYSAKKGLYYKEVKFKDDPGKTYVIQPVATYKGIVVQGFDTETKKTDKHAKHHKFDPDYKP
ncbi:MULTISPECIES: DUF3139 domain-containing protein [Staphylococcus]|uniref:DUF3139 domain-containing protein n=1 Tax=Staphylococcus pettenkoferi TaxID=170573 RepID=A0A1Z3U0R2_9STAP|nr:MULTISPECIES: DUF3139 domain-containing protein [Staphylococcus]ASE36846.1 DUF3139 domain-containing protein [Staphylococcus pettenkoferi]EHM72392.1 hypothetical protein SEVCU012_0451 [Staphylococcus pettenkoferi VCU012]MBX8994411.1 DUF3139 domain-containing protein [Staphylococcus pettenkoferi]MCI2792338.1 DUF3139 domain-containing protein [Staphylococcus pettenkoferi]MCI2802568.1 DUF3139 domain-containing protein [Staphylococcus pettenkoferi]